MRVQIRRRLTFSIFFVFVSFILKYNRDCINILFIGLVHSLENISKFRKVKGIIFLYKEMPSLLKGNMG